MSYKVLLNKKSNSSLKKLEKQTKERIKKKLFSLQNNPNLGKPLRYSNYFSIRVGDYRIIYEVLNNEKKILVLLIEHRKNVYIDLEKIFLIFYF